MGVWLGNRYVFFDIIIYLGKWKIFISMPSGVLRRVGGNMTIHRVVFPILNIIYCLTIKDIKT